MKIVHIVLILASVLGSACAQAASIQLPHADHAVDWPPRMEQPYPDLVLYDQRGELVHLSQFKGHVLLIEPIGMNCPACNALADGHVKGGFSGTLPENGVKSEAALFSQAAPGVSFDDPGIIHIQLLLYNFSMQGPTPTDARLWAEHFGYVGKPNYYVLAGGQELINQASYDMIPGFQLVDKQFILRADASGHHPSENWMQLMGKVPQLLKE